MNRNKIVINRIDDGYISIELNGKTIFEEKPIRSEEYMKGYEQGIHDYCNKYPSLNTFLGYDTFKLMQIIEEYEKRNI